MVLKRPSPLALHFLSLLSPWVLGVLLGLAPFWEARGDEGGLPLARGRLRFDAAHARFEGEMEWELRPGSGALALFLYLNRYLTATNREEREIVEAYGSDSAAVDRSQARRHGALLLRQATTRRYEGKPCSEVVGRGVAPTLEKKAPTTFNATETLLSTVALEPKEASEIGCRTFRLHFTSYPPASLGNFGVQSDGDVMKFAGPLFPVAQNTLFETEMHYEGISLTCADCRLETSQNSIQVTKTFPAPVLKAPASSPERVVLVRGLRVEFVGESDLETEAEITKMLERALLEGPFLVSAATESTRRLVRIHMGVLLKNLAARQHGEIQLGTGFLKVSPLFRKYHEAAFLRALFQELTFQALVRHVPPRNMEELRILNSLARMAAEERVASWFSSLDEIRAWSENFRFIPFFNDILQGKALVNNDVFLGSEEKPNPVDTLPFDAMFPSFRGKELAERLAWCHSVEEESAFRREAAELQKGELPAPDFVKRWQDLGKGRCSEPFRRYLFEASEPESITLQYGVVDESGGRVEFQRTDVPQLPRSLFRVPGSSPLRDTISLGVFAGKGDSQRAYSASFSGEGDRQTVVVEEPEDGVSARIEGPNTEGNKDVQVLPRRIDFLLTGIKVRYDSRVGQIEGEQGIQWRIRGDDTGRAFTLWVKKEKRSYFLEPLFSMTFGAPEEIDPSLPAVDERTLFRTPLQFPLGLGLSTEFAKETELWANVSVGARAVTSSVLVPSGYETKLSLSQSLLRGKDETQGLKVELAATLYLPLARLATGASSLRLGHSTEPQELGGPGNVPGLPNDALIAKRYAILKNELRYVAAYNLKWNILSTILFEDIVLYGAHNTAVDSAKFRLSSPALDSIQGIQFGIQFYGAFFGAKNQSISAEVARGLEEDPKNVYSVTVGRNF